MLAWREAVQAAAYDAAVQEERAAGKRRGPAFNYRWEHVQAVARLAVRLAALTGADAEVVEAAAWLHDVRKAYGRDHGREGALAARQILAQTDFPPRKIDAVADAIAKHVGLAVSEPVEPLEAAVIWDADKLSKLGATIVLHLTGYLVTRDGGYPITRDGRSTDQLIEDLSDAGWMEGAVANFHTSPARAAGRSRLETYHAFCRQARQELAGEDLGNELPSEPRSRTMWNARDAFHRIARSGDLSRPPPALIVVGGFAGSGKTALSRRLAAELGLPRLGSDTIGHAVRDSEGIADGNAYWIAYDVLFGLCEEYAASGVSAILDLTMGWAFQWQHVDAIVRRHPQVLFLPVLLRCPRETCLERIRQRYEADPERYDPPEVYQTGKNLGIWRYLERLHRPEVHWVDADRPQDQVYASVRDYVLDRLERPLPAADG
jgi:uncharacterized protein